jgi:hypothetical protein
VGLSIVIAQVAVPIHVIEYGTSQSLVALQVMITVNQSLEQGLQHLIKAVALFPVCEDEPFKVFDRILIVALVLLVLWGSKKGADGLELLDVAFDPFCVLLAQPIDSVLRLERGSVLGWRYVSTDWSGKQFFAICKMANNPGQITGVDGRLHIERVDSGPADEVRLPSQILIHALFAAEVYSRIIDPD